MVPKITLLELNTSIQEKIKSGFPDSIWVIAEISELKVNRNGHCYIELIEKDVLTDNIIARTRATIWAFTYRMLRPYFENTTGYELSSEIKILVQVNIEFHELYGFSLNILDIDPNYTLGDLAQKKSEIIRKLEDEGVINMNKDNSFPVVPQKIAVISSETAAGYQDFVNQLENNSFGFKFYIKLFPSVMQGLNAEASIIESLERIYKYDDFFDLVVIIRGGGSQADLNCFNNYLLATNIAQFPLPIITGIGHDKDESIVDIVAYKKLKTPTAAAEFIIEKTFEFEERLLNLSNNILQIANDFIQDQKTNLVRYSAVITPSIKHALIKHDYHLNTVKEDIKNITSLEFKEKRTKLSLTSSLLEKKSSKIIYNKQVQISKIKSNLMNNIKLYTQKQSLLIESLEGKNDLLNPENILKRGYSITYLNGEKLNNLAKINENDEIITKLFSGFIRSTVKEKLEKIKK